MINPTFFLGAAAMAAVAAVAFAAGTDGPTDAQIAHIAYTAGLLDVDSGKVALAKAGDPAVREFASTMVRDHQAVNAQALALVKKLGVTPQTNATSSALITQAETSARRLESLKGLAFDRAYVLNEAAYHRSVNEALRTTLIPAADHPELKSLLEAGLALFEQHQAHAETLSAKLK